MSTKCTVLLGKDYHLYREVGNHDIYLYTFDNITETIKVYGPPELQIYGRNWDELDEQQQKEAFEHHNDREVFKKFLDRIGNIFIDCPLNDKGKTGAIFHKNYRNHYAFYSLPNRVYVLEYEDYNSLQSFLNKVGTLLSKCAFNDAIVGIDTRTWTPDRLGIVTCKGAKLKTGKCAGMYDDAKRRKEKMEIYFKKIGLA